MPAHLLATTKYGSKRLVATTMRESTGWGPLTVCHVLQAVSGIGLARTNVKDIYHEVHALNE